LIDVPPETFVELDLFDDLFFFDLAFGFAAGRFDDGCDELGFDGFGPAVLVVVVEEVDVVVEDVVVVEVVVVVEPDGQTSDTPNTFKPAGINDDNGVPNGTLNTSPPTTCTRKTHEFADAAPGNSATPMSRAATPPGHQARARCSENSRRTVIRKIPDQRRPVTGG
jgi:hypothetical protein